MNSSRLDQHPALDAALSRLQALRPSDSEIFLSRQGKTVIEAKEGKIDTLTRSEDVGLSIRVIQDQRMGFSFTTSLEKAAVERAVESAFEIAQAMPKDPWLSLRKIENTSYTKLNLLDDKGLAAPINDKKKLAIELERLCRETDKRVTGVRSASVSEYNVETCLVDSQGAKASTRESLYSASITCKAEQDGDSQMGGDYGFSHIYSDLNIASVAKNSALFATELLGATASPTMQCPAIFRNNVVGELLDFLSASFSAENMDKGRSLLAGKEGAQVFAQGVSIIDDGLLEGGYATSPFDGEGIPSRKNILIRDGRLETALYDLYYAKKHGREPSGVSGRGIKSPPRIGFTNLSLEPGSISFQGLLKKIPSRGILVTDLMGLHTANPVTGDFSLGASGILIENGTLTRPVKGFAVAGNLLELLKRITDIGNDHRFFGNVGAPSVLISEISVGGS